MRHKYWFIFSLVMVVSLIISACAGATPTQPPTEAAAPPAKTEAPAQTEAPAAPTEPPTAVPPTEAPTAPPAAIKIGTSLPLTGGFAINGQKHKDGYQLCVDLINEKGGLLGRPLELLVSDNQSDTEQALAQVERFINVDKVDLLFATYSSKLTFPTSSIAEQAKMVYPIPSGAALRIYSRGYKYLFYFQPQPAEYIGQSVLDAIAELVPADQQPKTAAVVYADGFFSSAMATGLLGGTVEIPDSDQKVEVPSMLAEQGIEVVYSQAWPEEGFSDWVTLANSMKASNAEMVFGLTSSPDETIQLVRALQTVAYNPMGVYLSQGTQEEFKEGVGEATNGILIHASWHKAIPWEGLLAGEKYTNQDFIADFNAKFNRDPDEDEAIPFALCQGIDQAVRAVGSTDNTAIRDWLAARTADDPVKTILGDFHWDERGLPLDKSMLVTQWQDLALQFIYPVGEFPGTVPIVWPKPIW